MKTTLATKPHEFLLVSGGPLFQLYRRTHLAGDSLEWVRRRILVITLFVLVTALAVVTVRWARTRWRLTPNTGRLRIGTIRI